MNRPGRNASTNGCREIISAYGPLPALAAWVAGAAAPMIALWANRAHRRELTERLKALAPGGQLLPMLAVLEDPQGRAADTAGARAAAAELNRIEAELQAIAAGAAARHGTAARIGQEIAAGVGLLALAAMLALAVLG